MTLIPYVFNLTYFISILLNYIGFVLVEMNKKQKGQSEGRSNSMDEVFFLIINSMDEVDRYIAMFVSLS